MDHFVAIARERRALADVLDGLTGAQWKSPSMCEGWTTHEVLAHITMPLQLSMPRMMAGILRNRGDFNKYSRNWAKKTAANTSTGELIAILRAQAEHRFTPPRLDSRAPLTDIILHGYDIKLPLGIEAAYRSEDTDTILDLSVSDKASAFGAPERAKGLRFVTSDGDWSHGTGDEVSGPAVAIASALWGRRAAVEELSGPGVAEFGTRFD